VGGVGGKRERERERKAAVAWAVASV